MNGIFSNISYDSKVKFKEQLVLFVRGGSTKPSHHLATQIGVFRNGVGGSETLRRGDSASDVNDRAAAFVIGAFIDAYSLAGFDLSTLDLDL